MAFKTSVKVEFLMLIEILPDCENAVANTLKVDK